MDLLTVVDVQTSLQEWLAFLCLRRGLTKQCGRIEKCELRLSTEVEKDCDVPQIAPTDREKKL